jgi:serine/threonine protein kinase/tetratricopeptide (TPR) repeat protein
VSTDITEFRERLQSALGSAYTVERELGGGGMSRVFLARERRLDRDVVVKVLSPELAEGVSADRFERELRTIARLQHPNIVPLLAAGSSDGLPYYTMPYIRGESLRALLVAGTLTTRSATRVLGDTAHALAYAHSQGIVHRDIKPENVLIAAGIAVVTDFGISKALDVSRSPSAGEPLTQLGLALGTPAYMAPEQAAGDPATDFRADLYAWGVMAYESLAGAHPFAGRRTSQAFITAHMIEHPAPLAERSPLLPSTIASLVMQCLEKNPDARPASARAVIDALESTITAGDAGSPVKSPPPDVSVRESLSIAVLPFVNLSANPENEYFSDGITEEIRNLLAQDRALRVAARSSSFAFKGTPTAPRIIADQLSVRTLLEGSVRRAGNRVRIAAQLVNASDGFQLWSERFDRELTDIFAVQDEIASSIADMLRSTLHEVSAGVAQPDVTTGSPGRGPEPARTRPAVHVEAYDAYLKGRYLNHRRGEGHREAITHFQRALALDPRFAPALAGLAEAHMWLAITMVVPPAEAFTQTRRYAQAALALDPELADAHRLLGEIAYWHEWDPDATERHVRRALTLEPRNAETLQLSARLHLLQGHREQAIADCSAAIEADPVALGTRWYAVVIAYGLGDYDRAITAAERVIAMDPGYPDAFRWRGKSRCMSGDVEGGLGDLLMAARLSNTLPWLPAETAVAHCLTGDLNEARRIRDDLIARAERGWIPPSAIALAEQALGNYDAAFRWLERAYEARDFLCVVLPVEGMFRLGAPGRAGLFVEDTRWLELVRRVGMTPRPS